MTRSSYLRLLKASPTEAEAPTSVEAAFRMHASYVNAIALRILGRPDEADDVLQEIFLAALRDLRDLSNPFRVKQWFATATVRLARRKLRRRRVFSFFSSEDYDYESVASYEAAPEQRLLLASVYAALDRISTEQRLAWALRYIEGMDLKSVAEHCGCSLPTIKRRIAQAQAFIEAEISDD